MVTIGIPKERDKNERRVPVIPSTVHELVERGMTVYVEKGAGIDAGFTDEAYKEAGASICFTEDCVYSRADFVIKISPPTERDVANMRDGLTLGSFGPWIFTPQKVREMLREKGVSVFAFESITNREGTFPLLQATSVVCGRLVPLIAAHHSMTGSGGKGILLTSLPGIPSPDVVIVGGGIVGRNAARQFLALGCAVIVLDTSRAALERIDEMFHGRVETLLGTPANLSKVMKFADVLVCCAMIPNSPAPRIISREMVKRMKPRSLVIDVSIDHGGMCETSRPTTLEFPTFVAEDVVHYCVPNNASMVARTASVYLDNTLHRYLLGINQEGVEPYITGHKGLAGGIVFYKGELVNERVAKSLDSEFTPLNDLLKGDN